ncbi:MAG: metal ABC transporter ATP-binding protein [Muribaculum sp.]|nr:metal ABC transporter ATP-binding protein [Muribaculum sp.]
MKLIDIKDVTVRYDRENILANASLTIERGDFIAITGPNGGGKTTLLRTILKLLKPNSGEVTYYDITGMPTKQLRIGYLPQKSNIDTRFPITVAEVIKSGQTSKLFHRRTAADDKDFIRIVEKCGVSCILEKTVGELSGGQLQRTLLARALVSGPEVIVLDEPLSYVDKDFEVQIYAMIKELAKSHTIILVSHEMSVISQMANRQFIVNRGIFNNALCTMHYAQSCDECIETI